MVMEALMRMFGKEDPTLKAMIIYPTRKIALIKIPANKDTFTVEETKRAYRVDPDCIYYFKGVNVLVYIANVPQPIRFEEQEVVCDYNAQEFKAILENKEIMDLLKATDEGFDIPTWALVAGAVVAAGGIYYFMGM